VSLTSIASLPDFLQHNPSETLREISPDILVLNAGATPIPLPVHELTWEQFSLVWETDVKATFLFGKEALTMPMKPGSVVVITSSTAAIAGGSPLAGSYAGAKRMQWFLARYFRQIGAASDGHERELIGVKPMTDSDLIKEANLR
jgi:NAD(P)-dependent dehydrogenase (short-subunit alcohol dehydrogenase family)